jgi:Transposase IS200 like
MPKHVHLLVNEPEKSTLAQAVKSLKQGVARRLALRADEPFWQERYYDFNVWSERKFLEKLRYVHRNPVRRGLVARPEDWPWSSFRHYATGDIGIVEIESQRSTTARACRNFPGSDCEAASRKAPLKRSLNGAPSGYLMKELSGRPAICPPTVFLFCTIILVSAGARLLCICRSGRVCGLFGGGRGGWWIRGRLRVG